ncbi:hypothetical protein HispidOSU_003876 [Sigmodon hispidus]
MAGRDKDPLASCLEQQPKGDLKLCGQEMQSQASSEGPSNTGAAQSQKSRDTEEAQHEGQQVLDPSDHTSKQIDLELQQIKVQAKKESVLSKYTKGLNPPYSDPSSSLSPPARVSGAG